MRKTEEKYEYWKKNDILKLSTVKEFFLVDGHYSVDDYKYQIALKSGFHLMHLKDWYKSLNVSIYD